VESHFESFSRRILKRVFPAHFRPRFIQESLYFKYDERIERLVADSTSAYLDGYWQNPAYFSSIRENLRKELHFPTSRFGREFQVLSEEIRRSPNSVSFHVRRGDFVSNPATGAYYLVVEWDYYRHAFQWMKSQLTSPQVFVFSDDPEWCQSELPHLVPEMRSFRVVSTAAESREAEDFELMKLCRHHICANSTFSWWASYLGLDPCGIVTLPGRWTREYSTQADFGLRDWKILN
jgi:hypothetical protein